MTHITEYPWTILQVAIKLASNVASVVSLCSGAAWPTMSKRKDSKGPPSFLETPSMIRTELEKTDSSLVIKRHCRYEVSS